MFVLYAIETWSQHVSTHDASSPPPSFDTSDDHNECCRGVSLKTMTIEAFAILY